MSIGAARQNTEKAVFIRLLADDDKAAALTEVVAALRDGNAHPNAYTLNPADFAKIPSSPFAYWVGKNVLAVFAEFDKTETDSRVVRVSNETGDDFRFMRLWTEVSPETIGRKDFWVPHAKGGSYSPYCHDLHLLVAWEDDRSTIRGYYGRPARPDERMASTDFFFRAGLTYPRRTDRFSARVMPAGAVFSNKGVGIFVENDDDVELLFTVAIMNSCLYNVLIRLLSGRDKLAQSFEVGVVQKLPLPKPTRVGRDKLAAFALEAYNLSRAFYQTNETTHTFGLPGLTVYRVDSLRDASEILDSEAVDRQSRLATIQAQIDDIVFDLYGLGEADRTLVRREIGGLEAGDEATEDEDHDEESDNAGHNLAGRVRDLLMWCVGVPLGRWDICMALDPARLPPLGEPFDPLPRYAPGALIEMDASRVTDHASRASTIPPSESPLRIDRDGILVDDPDHPDDIVRRVRDVLDLLWGERAGAIEQEACAILGAGELRDYFRKPAAGGFWLDHLRRYSKSRRKAPIYWLLQSSKKSYALWLYYHRLDKDLLFKALVNYVEPKIRLEEGTLEGLRAQRAAAGTSGREAKLLERQLDRQEAFLAELHDFRDKLRRVADLRLEPDLNDGVILNIAALWELVPWKEAKATWKELLAGKYEWSAVGKQLRGKGLVK